MMSSHQWEEDERIEELKTVFEDMDDDDDDLLSPDEFHAFVQQTVNHDVPQLLVCKSSTPHQLKGTTDIPTLLSFLDGRDDMIMIDALTC
jgi:hypothetical protein